MFCFRTSAFFTAKFFMQFHIYSHVQYHTAFSSGDVFLVCRHVSFDRLGCAAAENSGKLH